MVRSARFRFLGRRVLKVSRHLLPQGIPQGCGTKGNSNEIFWSKSEYACLKSHNLHTSCSQTPSGAIAYFHHDFVRGRPELMKEIGGSKRRVQAHHDRQRAFMLEEQKIPAQDWTGVDPRILATGLLDLPADDQRRRNLANASQVTRDLLYGTDHSALHTTLNTFSLPAFHQDFTNDHALQLSAGLQSEVSPLQSDATHAALNYSLGLRAASLGATYADNIIPMMPNSLLSNVTNPLLPSLLEPTSQLMMHNNEVDRTLLAQYLEEARAMEQLHASDRLRGFTMDNAVSQRPSFPFMALAGPPPDSIQNVAYPERHLPLDQLRSDASLARLTLPSTATALMPRSINMPISDEPGPLERSEILSPPPPPPSTNSSITPIDLDRIVEQYLQQQRARQKDDTNK